MFNSTSFKARFFFIALVLIFFNKLCAQDLERPVPDLAKVELPPLEILFENVKKSGWVTMYDARIAVHDYMLSTEQRSWLKYFKVGGSYQYGNIAINSAFTNENTPLFMQTTGQIQNSWYGTAGVSVPLDDLFDRKNRIKKQKMERQYTENERDKWLDEQRIKIAETYMRVKLLMSTLHKKAEEYNLAKANFMMMENEFKLGSVTIVDLNTAKKQESEANDRFRTNEYDLMYELIKLEILSKTKIVSK
jgi:outer membrane protein TolC